MNALPILTAPCRPVVRMAALASLLLVPGCITPAHHQQVVAEVRIQEQQVAQRQLTQIRLSHADDLLRVKEAADEETRASEQALQASHAQLKAVQVERDEWKGRYDELREQLASAIADAVERGIAIGIQRRGLEAILTAVAVNSPLLLGMIVGGCLLAYAWFAGKRGSTQPGSSPGLARNRLRPCVPVTSLN